MKTLKFSWSLVKMILSGEKTATWRVNDDKDLRTGDIISCLTPSSSEFAEIRITGVKETVFAKLTPQDKEGHEHFASEAEMYETYSRYYKVTVTPETKLKIARFVVLKNL